MLYCFLYLHFPLKETIEQTLGFTRLIHFLSVPFIVFFVLLFLGLKLNSIKLNNILHTIIHFVTLLLVDMLATNGLFTQSADKEERCILSPTYCPCKHLYTAKGFFIIFDFV